MNSVSHSKQGREGDGNTCWALFTGEGLGTWCRAAAVAGAQGMRGVQERGKFEWLGKHTWNFILGYYLARHHYNYQSLANLIIIICLF